ncbi:hypothetical protein BAY61_13180 [Prauserella marina]|uniref:Uncharacterized protein n=1 Tax=Prauserella marina TaxID=530584 RepID=A0A222VPG1_9PSEU|nr:DUF5134 domain-containing protein [Prauserella marina]ASR35798.1 hypothetical protein BAY61_13180 [Prauserella marina]PWV84301.1 uncharacterized protein DUF5134 [Prauserella marina]SDC25856.1 protein of unknown function [Prauserella marina]
MIASPVLSWILSFLFAGTAAWCVRVLVLPSIRIPDRIDAGWHLLMSAAMIAMIWPWGMSVPAAAQAVVFTIAVGWFLGRMILDAGHPHSGGHAPRAAGAHHAVMMAGMAWMAASMPALMSTSGDDSGGGHHHHAMGGGTPMAQAQDTVATPVALTVSYLALGLVFVMLCLPWLAKAFDLGRRLPDRSSPTLGRVVTDHACHALMSFGMGVMFLAVV